MTDPRPLPCPTLTDGVVSLRVPARADVPEIVAACDDPEMARWTRLPSPYTHADAVAFVDLQDAHRAAGTDLVVLVFDAAASRPFVGEVGLHGISDGDAEIGYWTAAWARGRGLTTRAVRLLVEWGIAELGLERVEWAGIVGNEASRRVAEKVGFQVVGTLRAVTLQPGRRAHLWVGDLLPADLTAQQAPDDQRGRRLECSDTLAERVLRCIRRPVDRLRSWPGFARRS